MAVSSGPVLPPSGVRYPTILAEGHPVYPWDESMQVFEQEESSTVGLTILWQCYFELCVIIPDNIPGCVSGYQE